MARKEARISCGIWNDAEYRALPAAAQRLYQLVVEQPDLSYCGVIAYRPKRWALMAPDTPVRAIEAAVRVLVGARFLLVDETVDEVWVRTFIRHNKVLASPKLVIALAHDFCSVQSIPIREGLLEGYGEGLAELLAHGFREPLPEPFLRAMEERFPYVRAARSTINSQPSTHNPQPPSSPSEFDAFWDAYPRRTAKPKALQAWTAATRKAEAAAIVTAAEQYRDDPNRLDEFTAYPATWLNQERWNDGPLPSRNGRNGHATTTDDRIGAMVAEAVRNPL